jgi:hypothetical protein
MRWTKYLQRFFQSFQRVRPSARPRPNRRLELECLEERTLLSAFLSLQGSQTLVRGTNINASGDLVGISGMQIISEMQVAINPVNPLQVVGFTNSVIGGTHDSMSIFWSNDGGASWASGGIQHQTLINEADDGLGTGERSDPTLKFDADNHLFIAYMFVGSDSSSVVTARSDNGGQSFNNFRVVDCMPNFDSLAAGRLVTGVDKPFLTTGLDPTTGRQAVYIAYTINEPVIGVDLGIWQQVIGSTQLIGVVGSNDGGATYTRPQVINDDAQSISSEYFDLAIFAGPAVGPNGELYVVWHDYGHITGGDGDGQIKFDRDLDGLWGSYYHFGDDVVVTDLHQNLSPVNPKKPPADPVRGFENGPSIDVSRSFPFYGRIYLTYTDTVSGDDTDVYMVTSDDKGSTWYLPGSVNGRGNVEASAGTDFMATVAVDPTSGSVNVGYYTTAGTGTNTDVNFRLASSIDGGGTWAKVNLSSAPSRAKSITDDEKFGEYQGLAAYGGTVHAFWTDNSARSGFSDAETATASFHSATGGNTLFVTGTSDADTIVVKLAVKPDRTVNPDYVEVDVNGKNEFTGLLASLDAIAVFGYGGNDTISVSGLPVPVFVHGDDGNDTINVVLPDQNLGKVKGITVDGGDGTDAVALSAPQGPPVVTIAQATAVGGVIFPIQRYLFAGRTFLISPTRVSVAGSSFGGLHYSGAESVTVKGGGGNDTFRIVQDPQVLPVAIWPFSGDVLASMAVSVVTVPLSTTSQLSGSLITSAFIGSVPVGDVTLGGTITLWEPWLTVDGGGGVDTLVGPSWQNNTWVLTGKNEGYVGDIAFTSMANLVGGAMSDSFVFGGTASAVSGRVDGGGGSNWLYYSNYSNAVSVRLANLGNVGLATGTNGVRHIQNVIGSRTAVNTLIGDDDPLGNILVGGDAADTLRGGAARSFLIGGNGADVLTGGTAGDIIIAGFTDYDLNEAALQAIMSEWLNTTDNYLTRIAKIRAGIVADGNTYELVWGSGAGTTVHDDGAADTLRGDPVGAMTTGLDWFFANRTAGTLDTILDRTGIEKIN